MMQQMFCPASKLAQLQQTLCDQYEVPFIEDYASLHWVELPWPGLKVAPGVRASVFDMDETI